MPIKTVCPECQADYQLADQQAGKKVRCKHCQTVFVAAEESSRRTAIRGDGGPSSQARSKPDAATARRGNSSRSKFRDDDEPDEPRRGGKKKSSTWVVGGVLLGVGLLVVVGGGVAVALLWPSENTEKVASNKTGPHAPPMPPPPPANQPPQEDNQPVQGQPVTQPPAPQTPVKPADPPSAAAENDKRSQAERGNETRTERGKEVRTARRDEERTERGNEERTNNGRISAEGREHVRRATVYLRVKLADGDEVSGSGFIGCKEAPNIILTNAHVVGMLSPDSARPQSVQVVFNSGEANEWKTTARVLGVDRASDLAVLDIGTPPQPLPEPLTVKPAGGLHELDDVYVSGFPHGEQLGKEVSMRRASVSALRRKNGVIDRVQVEGGIDHGNSGGPVLDTGGSVVGVAVAVWHSNKQIGIAIPGERVHGILNGHISDLAIHQPYFTGDNKVAVPVVLHTIDPRNFVKEVGLEVWAGDEPPDAKKRHRPPATTQPPAQPGDSNHVYYKLRYTAPEGRAEIVLPELPKGKVYWQQPRWVNHKGQTHWAAAATMRMSSQPVYRKPINNLVLRYTQGAKRELDLTIENIFKVSENAEDADSLRIRTAAQFKETVVSTGAGATLLNLSYRIEPSQELVLPDSRSIPNPKLEQFKKEMKRLMVSLIQMDRVGNITLQSIDDRGLRRAQIDPKQIEQMKEFHETILQALESLSVSLPADGTATPLKSWKAERHLPIDTPGRTETGKLDVTFTYLGTRKRDGRDEAVISMDGLVRGKNDAVGGKAEGQIMVDLNNGQTILAETTVKLQLKALLSRPGEPLQEVRVVDTIKSRMRRKM
ncbi:MAG TPA: trypsin-like peptidase domain-containing protein [Gemmataceae bacterium]|nr:trypsin-like peptidase domain-containing protein [Gemmataceae bacterium]